MRLCRADAGGSPGPAAARHAQVHQHHVRLAGGDGIDGRLAVADRGDHVEAGRHIEDGLQAGQEDGMVIGDDEAYRAAHGPTFSGRRPRTVVPDGPVWMLSSPPSSAARSRMLARPTPAVASGGIPVPLSHTPRSR